MSPRQCCRRSERQNLQVELATGMAKRITMNLRQQQLWFEHPPTHSAIQPYVRPPANPTLHSSIFKYMYLHNTRPSVCLNVSLYNVHPYNHVHLFSPAHCIGLRLSVYPHLSSSLSNHPFVPLLLCPFMLLYLSLPLSLCIHVPVPVRLPQSRIPSAIHPLVGLFMVIGPALARVVLPSQSFPPLLPSSPSRTSLSYFPVLPSPSSQCFQSFPWTVSDRSLSHVYVVHVRTGDQTIKADGNTICTSEHDDNMKGDRRPQPGSNRRSCLRITLLTFPQLTSCNATTINFVQLPSKLIRKRCHMLQEAIGRSDGLVAWFVLVTVL